NWIRVQSQPAGHSAVQNFVHTSPPALVGTQKPLLHSTLSRQVHPKPPGSSSHPASTSPSPSVSSSDASLASTSPSGQQISPSLPRPRSPTSTCASASPSATSDTPSSVEHAQSDSGTTHGTLRATDSHARVIDSLRLFDTAAGASGA